MRQFVTNCVQSNLVRQKTNETFRDIEGLLCNVIDNFACLKHDMMQFLTNSRLSNLIEVTSYSKLQAAAILLLRPCQLSETFQTRKHDDIFLDAGNDTLRAPLDEVNGFRILITFSVHPSVCQSVTPSSSDNSSYSFNSS